jgi:hypothetical protein
MVNDHKMKEIAESWIAENWLSYLDRKFLILIKLLIKRSSSITTFDDG